MLCLATCNMDMSQAAPLCAGRMTMLTLPRVQSAPESPRRDSPIKHRLAKPSAAPAARISPSSSCAPLVQHCNGTKHDRWGFLSGCFYTLDS